MSVLFPRDGKIMLRAKEVIDREKPQLARQYLFLSVNRLSGGKVKHSYSIMQEVKRCLGIGDCSQAWWLG